MRRKANPLTSPGYRLASLVARHADAVFSTRRRLLRSCSAPDFDARARDPVVAGARPENERAARVVNVLALLYLNLWPTSITAVTGESMSITGGAARHISAESMPGAIFSPKISAR